MQRFLHYKVVHDEIVANIDAYGIAHDESVLSVGCDGRRVAFIDGQDQGSTALGQRTFRWRVAVLIGRESWALANKGEKLRAAIAVVKTRILLRAHERARRGSHKPRTMTLLPYERFATQQKPLPASVPAPSF